MATCDCEPPYTGRFCDREPGCDGQVYDTTDGTACCPAGQIISSADNECCAEGAAIDRDGKCCNSGALDACDICEGAGVGLDITGASYCLPLSLDAPRSAA